MSNLAHLQHLKSQVDEVSFLAAEAEEAGDVVAEMNFRSRVSAIESEIEQLERTDSNVAEVALLFDGRPVLGTASIDARFATKALSIFQDIVSKLYASGTSLGLKGARGIVPSQRNSSLRITEIARGSFGFVLEEPGADQSSAVATTLREALDEAIETIEEITQRDDDDFLVELDAINPRVFSSLNQFFKHLHSSEATLRAALPTKQLRFDNEDIERAYLRLSNASVDIKEEIWIGTLVGLSPLSRSFEFQPDDKVDVITGNFGKQVSQDYLERIENDGITLGSKFRASIEVARVRKPNGEVSIKYTALDLTELSSN
ncbi:hypothetical protein [Ruegeria atlantica]|uniref:Uncharacterized protein n=1 Tax=Ruegeria atlantica TaxID=81569 RepID=A0ABX1WCV0_9RHOB|nr:hypothetical protein [Ruegeria atlantica]NOD31108.1 hypothetical protein [Ruegeria atlantica]